MNKKKIGIAITVLSSHQKDDNASSVKTIEGALSFVYFVQWISNSREITTFLEKRATAGNIQKHLTKDRKF